MGGETPLSRLDALRLARRVVEQQAVRRLGLIDRWIAEEERREAERRRGEEMRPTSSDWLIQYGLNRASRGGGGSLLAAKRYTGQPVGGGAVQRTLAADG
ncbi:DUF6233 domain-containing protein [Streptomyces olivaceoviridis]